MPAADTVAKLNRIGGKTSVRDKSRLRARVSGLFSPEKADQGPSTNNSRTKRSSGQLQQKRLSRNGASTGRRNSLSLPDNEEDDTPAPKPKPKTRVVLKNSKAADNHSPLKKHGYNLESNENPSINLTDSPSRNTRSKNSNPLEALRRAKLPIPESLDRRDAIPIEKSAQPRAPNDEPNARKRVVESDVNPADRDHEESRPSKRTKPNPKVVKEPEQAHDRNVEEEPHGSQVEDPVDLTPIRKPGRPKKNAETDVAQLERLAREKEQREQAAEQEKRELKDYEERYIRSIEDAVEIHGCTELWSKAGGGAFFIRAKAGSTESQSTRGKAIDRVMKQLDESYKAIRSRSATASQVEDKVKKRLELLDGRCKLLESTGDSERDRRIVKDIFLFIIPSMVMTLRRFLRGRGKDGTLSMPAKRELVMLLDIVISICNKAQAWQPQPSTLEWGIRSCIRNDILPSLKMIKIPFADEVDLHNRREEEHLRLQDLGIRSHTQHQKLLAKYAQEQSMKLQRRRSKLTSSVDYATPSDKVQKGPDSDGEGVVFDVDDIDKPPAAMPSEVAKISSQKQVSSRTDHQGRRPPLQRESTADLPPPLAIDFSEEEKIALLNGLQAHTGKHRYNEILNDNTFGAVLGKRDLDDLVKAATSFSQMMASKMGIEAYHAEKSLWWLHSADPDA